MSPIRDPYPRGFVIDEGGQVHDVYVPGPSEPASPDDPIVHGLRWREERDRYRAALERIVERPYADGTTPVQVAREALRAIPGAAA